MKFYKRFPGDITIKTGDLTLVEFGAYDRLLDHYYAKEQPIDPTRAYTVARCQSASDRKAVDRVLAEYWTLTDAGWVQERADEMIAEALPRIEAAKLNGLKGGRPKGSIKKPTGLFPETQGATETVDSGKASQSQSKPSPPSEKKVRASRLPPPDCPADVDPAVWRDWLALRQAKKAPVTPTVVGSATAEAAKAGMTLEAFLRIWCARGSQGLQADWLKAHERPQQSGTETPRDRAAREKVFLMTGGLMGAKPYGASSDTIDIKPARQAALG